MGRNPKQGIDYFPADVDMFQDRKIKRLLRSAGGKGVTIYIYLLTDIYRDRGYYYEWDKHSAFDISDELNFSESVVEETVKACCSIGLFNEALFSEKSIISSESIQNRWQKIVTDANRTITDIDPELKITDGKPSFTNSTSKETNQEEENSKEQKRAKIRDLSIDDFPKEDKISRFTVYCWKMVKENHPSHDTVNNARFNTWYDPLRKLIEYRDWDIKYARKIWDWAVNESFWQANIRSTAKFYDQREELDAQYKRDNKSNNQNLINNGKVDIEGINNDIDEILADRKAAVETASTD